MRKEFISAANARYEDADQVINNPLKSEDIRGCPLMSLGPMTTIFPSVAPAGTWFLVLQAISHA